MPAHTADGNPSTTEVVDVINPTGAGPFILVCEHASNFIPAEFGNLGLGEDALESHIAWDPGALTVARELSSILDAPLVAQRVSRLVYDCNRPPEAPSAIPAVSEIYEVPGNANLSWADRQRRVNQVYTPFRNTLAALIDSRVGAMSGLPVIFTVHSFTPVYLGVRRDLDIGILHDADARFADSLIEVTKSDAAFRTRRNEPYGPQDGVTHTLVEHAIPRGLLNVMIEIRNDLIGTFTQQRATAEWLAKHAASALREWKSGNA